MVMFRSNKSIFEAPDVIGEYAAAAYLYGPEEEILKAFKARLGSMRMLDIGVGGGRTTLQFAKYAREYVGIDYSRGMIEACKKRFSSFAHPNVIFEVCDAASMGMFEDGSFDFILCAFNGLDYMPLPDRLRALREIKRVGRPGGLFLFSAHNLHALSELFRIKLAPNPVLLLREAAHHLRLRLANAILRRPSVEDHAVIIDGSYGFRLRTTYIEPRSQVAQLQELGFKAVSVYALDGGKVGPSGLEAAKDNFLYYLAEM